MKFFNLIFRLEYIATFDIMFVAMGTHSKMKQTKKKVLFTYFESGNGHITSMKSISDNVKALYGDKYDMNDCYIMREDNDKTLIFFEKFIKRECINTNRLWGFGAFMFKLFDVLGGIHFTRFLWRTLFGKSTRHLIKALEKRNPDVVVSTHFVVTFAALEYRKKVNPNVIIITYNPDNNIYAMWDNRPHLFIVNNHQAYMEAVGKRKFNSQYVKEVSFPARDEIVKYNDTKAQAREKLGIDAKEFCVIVADGAYACAKAEKSVRQLLKSDKNMTLMFVAGKNKKLYDKYTKLIEEGKVKSNIHFKVLPFMTNIHEYYRASDVFVTKGGPNAILDSMYMNTPVIVNYYAHPVEKFTTKLFVNEIGGGEAIYNMRKLAKRVDQFIDNPQLLDEYVKNTYKLDKVNNGGIECAKLIDEKITNGLGQEELKRK